MMSDDEYVATVNSLLEECEIQRTVRFLSDCSPSMFIVLYEAIIGERVSGINRDPTRSSHHIENMKKLIQHISKNLLSERSNLELSVNAEKLYRRKDKHSIRVMISLLKQIWDVIKEDEESSSDDEEIEEDCKISSTISQSSRERKISESSKGSGSREPSSDSITTVLQYPSSSILTSSARNQTPVNNSSINETDERSDDPTKDILKRALESAAQKLLNIPTNNEMESKDQSSILNFESMRNIQPKEEKRESAVTVESAMSTFVDDDGLQLSSIEGSLRDKSFKESQNLAKSYQPVVIDDLNEIMDTKPIAQSKYSEHEFSADDQIVYHNEEDLLSQSGREDNILPKEEHSIHNEPSIENHWYTKETSDDDPEYRSEPIPKRKKRRTAVSTPKKRMTVEYTKPVTRLFDPPHQKDPIGVRVVKSELDPNIAHYEKVYYNYLKSFVDKVLSDDAHFNEEHRLILGNSEKNRKIENIKFARFKQEQERLTLSQMIERRSKEEKFLREVFSKVMGVEKEELIYEKMRRKEDETNLERKNKIRLTDIENFYRDQIQILKERVTQEQFDRKLSQKAQKEATRRMWREVQENRKKELNLLRLKWQSLEERKYHTQFNKEVIAKQVMKKVVA